MKLSYRSRLALIALLLALSTLFTSCNLLGGSDVTSTQETTLADAPTTESSPSDTPSNSDDSEQKDTGHYTDEPSEPTETEPSETEPSETEPSETELSETEPSETEPSETEPSETEPTETEPSETEPSETEPSKTEPSETEPSETEPPETEPSETEPSETEPSETEPSDGFDYTDVPAFSISNQSYVEINGNVPYFTQSDYTTKSYECYSPLDVLGRCGIAMACIGKDIMPTEERGDISSVKPTGWVQASYDGTYLYDRCHLIGFQLTGENANKQNLITGTKYFNVAGMLGFENMVADYIKETNNHVLYRVTPVFVGNELVARGVLMEAWSVEDNGDGICFNVFVYNVQPGVAIDYATGESQEAEIDPGDGEKFDYVANKSSYKFHYSTCSWVEKMNESNKEYFHATHDEMIQRGYDPCGTCKP